MDIEDIVEAHDPRRHTPGRWIRWAAPLTAAAAVAAAAIALVVVKGVQNGSSVPANPASSTAGPGGVPRYYVALKQLAGDMNSNSQLNDIVVGDSLTGRALATFAPPARTAFESVTAAADDRTFVVFAVTSSNGQFAGSAKDTTITGSWYEVRLTPGAADPARLSRLPIQPQTVPGKVNGYWSHGLDEWIDSFATALSGSGKELAVPEATAQGLAIKVFSVPSGQLLHDWTVPGGVASPSLTWIDGDQELAIESGSLTGDGVREWPVAEPDNGDLVAHSTAVWDPGPWDGVGARYQYCFQGVGGGQNVISADGKTIYCALGQAQSTDDILSFIAYPLATSTTAAEGRIVYEVTLPQDKGFNIPAILWISPSGGTFIEASIPYTGSSASVAYGLHIGVISHGAFTPLRLPPSLLPAGQQLQPDQIAF